MKLPAFPLALRTTYHVLGGIVAVALVVTLAAQVPNTLIHTIPAPPGGAQTGAALGFQVAVDGAYTVVGAPGDDLLEINSGVVKVFDSTTGALRFVLPNPDPAELEGFGAAVAISGTRVAVGAPRDDTGADNAGSTYVYDLSGATPTIPVATLNNPSPAFGDGFGVSVAISGTRIAVGAWNDDTGGTDAGSAYLYDLASATPAVPVATLNNPSPKFHDGFGNSVAISGTRVAVGAYQDDTGVADAGSSYVYDLASATPTTPVAILNNPSPGFRDGFGNSVAILGTRVVVGASGDDTGATDSGTAYVYDLGSATPTVPVATLSNPSPAPSDNFGISVAISAMRVVVGAQGDDTGAISAGSAYVFDLSSETPTVPAATLHNPDPANNDNFGVAVAISGTSVVVGTPGDDTGAGSAYVYEFPSATPTVPMATLNNPGPAAGEQFGFSIALSGTLLVVGAPGDYTTATADRSVYVYDLSSRTPTVPMATLNNPDPEVYNLFGYSVAISGTWIVVVNPRDGAGSAYAYDFSTGTPTAAVATLKNPSPVEGSFFGNSVAISGSLVVVGAALMDTGANDAGSAYVYDLSSATPMVPVATLHNPSPVDYEEFGHSVAISGTRVVVGALHDHTVVRRSGSAYVYDLSSSTPTVPVATLNNPTPAEADEFGTSVGISGMRVVVGAPGDDSRAWDAGSAYVYDLSSSTPTVPVLTLNNPGPAMEDYFGSSVAISGSRVVVGTNFDDSEAANSGIGYVYDLNNATPKVPVATLKNPSPAAEDRFSFSVAIDGNTVAIGAPFDNSPQADKGAAYIYRPHPLDQDTDGLLDSWELTYWPTIAGHVALDDFDRDGYAELLELAFALNPTLPDVGSLPAVTHEGGYLTMTITKHPGVTYEIQTAGTLRAAQPNSFSPATTTKLIDSATTLKVRDNFLIGAASVRFMRVKVTAAP